MLTVVLTLVLTNMLTVSIRDFQLKANSFINQLPVMLTRHNLEVALVISKEDFQKLSEAYTEKITQNKTNTEETKDLISMRCDMPFCKSLAKGHYNVSVSDNIEGTIREEHWLCPIHWHKANKEGGAEEYV